MSGSNCNPLDLIRSCRKTQFQGCRSPSIEIKSILPSWLAESSHYHPRCHPHGRIIGIHVREVETVQKISQHPQLSTQSWTATSGSLIGQVRPIFVANSEGVIEIIERMDTPLPVAVNGAEQCQFHYYALTVCLADEVLQLCQMISIKPVEVESVSTACLSPLIAA